MGSACSRDTAVVLSTAPRAQVPPPRHSQRQQLKLAGRGGATPLSLLELSVRCVAQHLESRGAGRDEVKDQIAAARRIVGPSVR